MSLWKKISNKFKRYEEWIEIKVPDYLKNKRDDLFDDEERISQDFDDIRKEEE